MIPLPSDCTTLHVLVSGGADSALLLYLLAKQNPTATIRCHSYKYMAQVLPVVQWVYTHTNKALPVTQWGGDRNVFVRIAAQTVLLEDPTGYVFTGCNAILETVNTEMIRELLGVENILRKIPTRGPVETARHLRPFLELTKQDILQEFINEDILDLLAITRSCNTGPRGRCNRCYFCRERAWAVKCLGIADPDLTV